MHPFPKPLLLFGLVIAQGVLGRRDGSTHRLEAGSLTECACVAHDSCAGVPAAPANASFS